MKVRELIAELQRVGGELEVIVDVDDPFSNYTVDNVAIDTQETHAGFSRPTVATLILTRLNVSIREE